MAAKTPAIKSPISQGLSISTRTIVARTSLGSLNPENAWFNPSERAPTSAAEWRPAAQTPINTQGSQTIAIQIG